MYQRPKIDMPYSTFEKMMHFLALLFIVVTFFYSFIVFPSLPEKIPIHFNAVGEADNWGSKYFIFGLALINIPSFLLLYFLGKAPHTHNYPIKITEENAWKVYKESQRMFALLNASVSFTFFIITIEMIHTARGNAAFGQGMIIFTIVIPLLVVIIPLIRIMRFK